jgi:predicted dehydrogenase
MASAGAVAAGPLILVRIPGQASPNERIGFGLIGCGGQGRGDMGGFLGRGDCQVLAVCDVDDNQAAQAKKQVEDRYKKDTNYKGCEVYKDFRKICERKDIGAMIVGTVDHWHHLCSLTAVRNGKDVYCEKPVTHYWKEGNILVAEVAKAKRIWQTGSQQRSEWNFRRAVDILINGHIGKIQHVEVGLPTGRGGHKKGQEVVEDPPANLDYDMYCGPSKKLPYMKARTHWDWRWNLNFGGGQLMDWIGHHNDIAHWGMGEDLGGPIEVEAAGFVYPEDPVVYDAPYHYNVKCKYAGGVTSSIGDGKYHPMGTKWTGDKGWVYVNRGHLSASNPDWVKKDFDPGEKKAYQSPGHHANFAECIKSRKPCICPVEVSHRSITPGHLGYLSDKLKRPIKWDPKAEKVIGDPEADKILNNPPYRDPWKIS